MSLQSVICTILGALLVQTAFTAPRDAQWKRVDEAVQKGLPKTAIAELDPIIQSALREKAYGEAVKAIGRKLVLEGNIQGNKPEEKITRLEAEIARAPKEIVPLLETLQAHWYWQYFQNNRWRFMRRTATAQPPGKDFTTWDLPRLFAEIDRHFQAALSVAPVLKKTPVSVFDELLEKGTMPDKYRPTVYDFVAHEALKFYASGEQAAAKSEDVFEISADGPIFGTTEEFINWNPQSTDTNSPSLKAVRVFQELLRFHRVEADGFAFFHNDLERLVFGKNVALGETKNARLIAALQRFPEGHEMNSMARHQWAQVLREEAKLVEARNMALEGERAFPESPGGKLCHNLAKEIEAKSFSVITERVWNSGPTIQVRYKNLTNLYFRAIPYDWNLFEKQRYRTENLSTEERRKLLTMLPTFSWAAKLPGTPEYNERTEELAAPDLKPGFYFIAVSHDPEFVEADNYVMITDVWVSDLALILRPRNGVIEGFVLEANSGNPVVGAEVVAWHWDRDGNRAANPQLATDDNGLFTFAGNAQRAYLFRVRHNGRELVSQNEYATQERHKPENQNQTVFFTDRAIYRPGQIIQYKGICLRVDQEKDNYNSLSGTGVEVIFDDPNGKEIARQKHRCNEYGSFTGSFTAPANRVTGRMSLRVMNGPQGAAAFSVEEYKRPKFQVTLDAPKEGSRLNEKVAVTGKALAYTGAAIDGAPFKYRVVRQVQMPYWWGWFSWRAHSYSAQQQEIAHGTGRTENDGSFKIEFIARPDLKVPEKDEPVFVYVITADVTDNAGETRSDTHQVQVGYTALRATVTVSEWQTDDKPVEISIRTETLDWVAQKAEGILKIYRLKAPATVQRSRAYQQYRWMMPQDGDDKPDLSNPNNWELGELAFERGITTDTEGKAKAEVTLAGGAYRAVFETQDRFGKKVTGFAPIQVMNPNANKLVLKVPDLLAAPKWTLEPGQEFMALWGTGYDRGRAFIEIEHRNKVLRRFWTDPANTQIQIRQAIDEAMRGGFTLHITRIQENRAYLTSRHVDVPWSNKNLEIKWEHFTSKLEPAQKETWTAIISGPDAHKAVAEMVATLYDASLDAFIKHYWQQRLSVFRQDYTTASPQFENMRRMFQWVLGNWNPDYVGAAIRYREFPEDLVANFQRYDWSDRRSRGVAGFIGRYAAKEAASLASDSTNGFFGDELSLGAKMLALADKDGSGGQGAPRGPDLAQVVARKNLNETAFFFPQLISDANGNVKMQFTMPEALTEWRFLGFAHDKELRSGFLEDKLVTAKDLMVQPNPPRFVREGDTIEFTAKVSNQTAARQTGKIRLTFNLASDSKSADTALGNTAPELEFDIPAKESRGYSWRIKIPDGLGFLTYKVVASTGRVSDGEEGNLPVLSRRIFVTESLPLPIRGPGSKKFDFTKLARSGKSSTLAHQSLTVQMVSNPSWYAVMALPYLMEFPYECSEQIFNRLYGNSLARHIANSDPKIRRIFDQWKNTPALDSPLEKNQDLKSVMLEETPWYRQAQSESQARRNVGILFDANRLDNELANALRKLTEQQLNDGSWPWFPGGRGNDYITLYITTGFGRLRHLGADIDVAPAIRSLTRLDTWIDETYRDILARKAQDGKNLTSTIALYLYARSFFLQYKPIDAKHNDAVQYFLRQAKTYWLELGERQSQGHLAISLKRFGDKETAKAIMKSIGERSVSNEEVGMFWRDTELSWWWYRAPIETQALMIEAFDEVANDPKAVEECKVWLLKQKQTQDWKTTRATADAVYALLLRGWDALASDARVEVSIGGKEIKPEKVEAGTGFYEQKFSAPEIKPKLSQISVKKVDQGVAWGSVHWQYFEDMSKVTPHEGTPLKLKKSLYTKVNTTRGPVLQPVKAPVKVGDELVVRVELRTDRDMEYVHLKDQRGSGTEPLNVISHYKYQDGLAYYESTRDTASHFFIDYLPKGVYVFEYSTRVFHKGAYQSGIADIQCMYAPEFNSHSESLNIVVN